MRPELSCEKDSVEHIHINMTVNAKMLLSGISIMPPLNYENI
jgi:hypothetical protein